LSTVSSRREDDARARFADRYREERVDVVRTIERAVIGGDWGANGYTTAAQADRLAELLELDPSSLLLDVGAGRGWPGLYLAANTGCSVVLSDVPLEGLIVAAARARTEGLSARAWCVNASARDNPFRDATFDAVVHTDVLC
jgi:2-polyprenyl-3-methyl-5-hydroxy-6-metoxy-1,4-benzoquinol methylase